MLKKAGYTRKLSGEIAGLILFVISTCNLAQANVIPEKYETVTLPKSTLMHNFSAFTAINNNGLAVGYGSLNTGLMGFVYDFENKKVIAVTADFFPFAINDNNTIAGIKANFTSNPLATCVINAGTCKPESIEGAELVFPFTGASITNSNIISSDFFYNDVDRQFRLYKNGELIYSVPTAAGPERVGQVHYDSQLNNMRLFVGAFISSEGFKSPFVKILNTDNSVRTLHLPNPDGTRSAVATSVNSRNDIIISTFKTDTENASLYLCRFVESLSPGEEAACKGGLVFLGESEFGSNGINKIALNDRGLLVTPGRLGGLKAQLYDLTQLQPVAVPLASTGFVPGLFAIEAMPQVNNNGVILAAPTKVLLVPVKSKDPFAVNIKQDDIVVPYDGIRMQFAESIVNNSNVTQSLSYWRIFKNPDGTPVPRGSVKQIQLAPAEMFSDSRVRLGLRSTNPPGNYEYRLYVMDKESGRVISDKFTIIKSH